MNRTITEFLFSLLNNMHFSIVFTGCPSATPQAFHFLGWNLDKQRAVHAEGAIVTVTDRVRDANM